MLLTPGAVVHHAITQDEVHLGGANIQLASSRGLQLGWRWAATRTGAFPTQADWAVVRAASEHGPEPPAESDGVCARISGCHQRSPSSCESFKKKESTSDGGQKGGNATVSLLLVCLCVHCGYAAWLKMKLMSRIGYAGWSTGSMPRWGPFGLSKTCSRCQSVTVTP